MEGVAKPEAIDEIMKLGMSHPMGPLQLADLIGLDVCLSIMNVLKDGFNNDPKYEPCPLLIKLCKENKLPIGILNINDKNNLKNFLFSSKII